MVSGGGSKVISSGRDHAFQQQRHLPQWTNTCACRRCDGQCAMWWGRRRKEGRLPGGGVQTGWSPPSLTVPTPTPTPQEGGVGCAPGLPSCPPAGWTPPFHHLPPPTCLPTRLPSHAWVEGGSWEGGEEGKSGAFFLSALFLFYNAAPAPHAPFARSLHTTALFLSPSLPYLQGMPRTNTLRARATTPYHAFCVRAVSTRRAR